MSAPVVLFDAQCASCDHGWRALVEEDPELGDAIAFGLECPECHDDAGRCVSRRVWFPDEQQAMAHVAVLQAGLAPPDGAE